MLAISILLSQRAYFTQWATRPDLGIAWDVGFTELAGVLADYDSNDRVYLDPRGADHPTVRYLLLNDPDPAALQGFDGRVCVRVATDRPATYIVLAQEDARGANLLQSYLPAANAQPLLRDAAGETWALSLEQPANAPVAFPEMTTQPTDLSDGIQLAGYWLSQEALQAGQRLYVRLFWGAAAAPQKNYTAFAHLLRSDGAGGFLNLAGADRPPGNGSCPTNEWLPGEMIVDELEFVLPDALASGEYYLEVGFYDPSSGQRLEVPGDPASRVLIGPLATAN